MLDSPIHDFLVVPALVASVEIRPWVFVSLNPVPCYHRHVGIAHDGLPDHFNTMICDVHDQQECINKKNVYQDACDLLWYYLRVRNTQAMRLCEVNSTKHKHEATTTGLSVQYSLPDNGVGDKLQWSP